MKAAPFVDKSRSAAPVLSTSSIGTSHGLGQRFGFFLAVWSASTLLHNHWFQFQCRRGLAATHFHSAPNPSFNCTGQLHVSSS
jgi:hypothetical protein